MGVWDIDRDIRKCLLKAKETEISIPPNMVDCLIAAEDHRNSLHFGIDPIAILRALYIRVRTGECQGASTIEQQYVRVVTKFYEKTFTRKFREQILAVTLVRRLSKTLIAEAYLRVAFYGSGLIGVEAIEKRYEITVSDMAESDLIRLVARLKYPEPITPSDEWRSKISHREEYIHSRLQRYRSEKDNHIIF